MPKVRIAVALLVLIAGLAQVSGDATAALTRLEIASKTAYGSFKPGDYTRWDVRVIGELSPTADAIPDLETPNLSLKRTGPGRPGPAA